MTLNRNCHSTATIGELVDSFLRANQGFISDHTIEWYYYYLRPLREAIGDFEISKISTDQLLSVFHMLDDGEHSRYTLSNYVRSWRRFFRWCLDEGFIHHNPAQKLRKPPLPKKSPAGISEDDLSQLLQAAQYSTLPERNTALILFLADTGARLGGAASLTLDHLDLVNRRALVTEKGRGGKRERIVFLSPRVINALKKWLVVRGEQADERVFLLSPNGIYQVLERLAKKAGVKGRWNPHSFRHAYARKLLREGVSIGVVSHLMGHSSVTVTLDFYGRFSGDELQMIYDKVMKD
ncbi:tyrosine-type recombinase/integrase [Thermanaerothrix sp.]|uniref:tyrosine-type recombinase/integrase n=1 Tax=Thermanaerothrix sp. TaxID=2972675 RepID=UPI002ADE7942|nr:tyrosine-type recombinase/integrase [Thermanaerothrix sp.]